jgi:hypothetical protein
MNCPVVIRLKQVTRGNGWAYQISKIWLEHQDHPVSAEVCALYPENRRIVMTDTVKAMCSLASARPMEVRKFIEQSTHQKIVMSDVYNMKVSMKGERAEDEDEILNIGRGIIEKGGFFKISIDDEQVIIW